MDSRSGADADPEAPVTGGLSPGDPGGSTKEPKIVAPHPGMADVRPIRWEKAQPRRRGRELLVSFWSGVEPCHVLDRVEVDYGPDEVVVTLFQGREPDAEDVACAEIALLKAVRVPLDEPLDGRELVDGASGR